MRWRNSSFPVGDSLNILAHSQCLYYAKHCNHCRFSSIHNARGVCRERSWPKCRILMKQKGESPSSRRQFEWNHKSCSLCDHLVEWWTYGRVRLPLSSRAGLAHCDCPPRTAPAQSLFYIAVAFAPGVVIGEVALSALAELFGNGGDEPEKGRGGFQKIRLAQKVRPV